MLTCNHQYLPKMNSMLRPGPWAWAWAEAAARRVSWCPRGRLRDVDREVWSLVYHEKERQRCALELAPSENFCSRAVQECLGSCLSNKLSVRKPSKGPPGDAVVQPVEQLCQRRALEAFGLDNARWGVDVRLHSGAAARAAALTALLRPHERFMAPEAPAVKEASDSSPLSAVGGDDEAGARTPGPTTPRHALGLGAATGGLFEVVAYPMDPRSGLVDYEALTKLAQSFRPRVILARAASSPRLLDLIRFRSVCDHVGAILLTDYAQEAGLVAARVIPGPFEQSDVVTAACHHTLRGPRCGLLFYRRSGPAGNIMERLESERVRQRCTPHNNVIAAAAVALREAQHDFFFEYQQQVVNNAKAMSLALTKLGHLVRTTGTDTHLVLLDLSGRGMSSHQAAIACDVCGIAVARGRLGLRLGTAALTSRGLQPAHFSDAAFLLDRALHLGARAAAGLKPGVCIEKVLNTTPLVEEARKIKEEVIRFIERFPMPGFENT